jgi:hypothetical protein
MLFGVIVILYFLKILSGSRNHSVTIVSFIDPYLRPTVTNVNIADNGGVNITWSHANCSETFPFTTMVYYRNSSSSEWTLDATTHDSSHVINSILFPPNAVFQFKVNTRYVINYNQVTISDDSVVFNFTIPGE